MMPTSIHTIIAAEAMIRYDEEHVKPPEGSSLAEESSHYGGNHLYHAMLFDEIELIGIARAGKTCALVCVWFLSSIADFVDRLVRERTPDWAIRTRKRLLVVASRGQAHTLVLRCKQDNPASGIR